MGHAGRCITLFIVTLVDIEPGVTVEHIFNLIDRDQKLKHFLAEYCSCDLDEIRQRTPKDSMPIEVFTDVEWDEEGHAVPKGTATVDTVVIAPFFYAFTDSHTGTRQLEGSYILTGASSKYEECATTFGGNKVITYGEIKKFVVKLNTLMDVAECDEDKCTEKDRDTIIFSANIRYTLLDVLTTMVGHFSELVFDPRYQREIDDENEMWERFQRGQEDPDSSDDVDETS